MPAYICVTCGVQYADLANPPAHCLICEEERQYLGAKGQRWTTLEELRATHHNRIADEEPGLTGIGSDPSFAIGQRALLIQSPGGNILWDCVSLIDDATIAAVKARGGAKAIAICHPHFYSSMIEWSRALGNIPIYLHAADRQWVMRPDPAITFWDGDTCKLTDDITLVHCGGHFAGSSALHWASGASGKGALLTGDTIQVVSDHRFVSFMYSYPNLIPLNAAAVNRIVQRIEPFAFDRLYGGWWERLVSPDAKGAVKRSAERYLRAIQE